MEEKPKRRSSRLRNADDAVAYIAAGKDADERIRRKYRCIALGLIPNDFTNRFFNHFGFLDNDKNNQNDAAKYWRTEQRDPSGF
jgi:hypothetical protein